MFLSLPPSLLLLLLASLLESRTAAASAPSPTPQAGGLGGYIASGLGANNGSASRADGPSPSNSVPSTGTGSEYASKCEAALESWSKSSFDWQWDNAIVTTSTFSSAITETLQRQGTTKVTSVITLCDGHPRVVGHTSVSDGATYTSTEAWTNTITQSKRNSAYPTPAPCSIQPGDCKALSSSFDKKVSELGEVSGGPPLCSTAPSSSYSYSTDNRGNTCDNCMIHAATARVMFWPVTTGSNGNLCNKTASTITSSATGPPASFVTEGITITSPTVAVSLGYLSRVDKCGTTVNHTIIPVKPEEVTSVRGFRALFEHHRFNFADLNYFCMDTNTTNYTLADGAPADSCYQQVPAAAYFGGLNNAVVLDQAPFRNLTKDQMTIYNDYQPQLLPPATMTHAIASLWGDGCIIHPDGVWDPPIALTPEATLDLPSYGPGATTSKDQEEPEKTPASPINEFGPVSPQQTGIKGPSDGPHKSEEEGRQHFTALPETVAGNGNGDGGDGGQGQQTQGRDHGVGGGQHAEPTQGANGGGSGGSDGSGSEGNGAEGTGSDGSDGLNGGGSGHAGDSSDSSGSGGGQSGSGESGSGGSDGNQSGDGKSDSGSSNVGSEDTSSGSGQGGSGQSNGGDVTNGGSGSTGSGSDQDDESGASNPSGVTSINVHTTVITVGTKSLTCSEDSNGAWVIPDASTTHTVSAGGSAVEVDAVTVTAGSDGLVQMDASGTKGSSPDASDDGSSQSDASGTDASVSRTQSASDSQTESNRVQLTSATVSGNNAEATNTDASGTSDADSIRWSPATLALVLTAIYFSVL